MLEFTYPWLALLAPLPLLLNIKRQATSQTSLRLPALARLAQEHKQQAPQLINLPSILAASIWLLMVLAATQPRWVVNRLPYRSKAGI